MRTTLSTEQNELIGGNPVINQKMEDLPIIIQQSLHDNDILKSKIKELDTKLENYKNIENTINNTLLVAQKTSDEVINNSKEKATNIIKEAEINAQDLLNNANKEVFIITQKLATLETQKDLLISKILALLHSQEDFLKNYTNLTNLNKVEETEDNIPKNVAITHKRIDEVAE